MILPLGAVLPLKGHGTTTLYPVPSSSHLSVIFLFVFVAYARSFWLFCVFVCVVPGDEVPEHQARRVNPGRASSKRYRTTEPAGGSYSAPPPPHLSKKPGVKPKPGKTVPEMPPKEFWARRRRNLYEVDQDPTLVNRPFWNRFQFAIFFDVLKAKKNFYVNVHSIDTDHME